MLLFNVTRHLAPKTQFFTYTELYLQPACQYRVCHILKNFDLAEIIAHRLTSLMHFTIHFWPSVTLHAPARYPGPSEGMIINPGWKALMKPSWLYHTSIYLRFTLLACQNAFNNQLFSNWLLLVSIWLLIYLIINAYTLHWRLLKQHNLFVIAIPKSSKAEPLQSSLPCQLKSYSTWRSISSHALCFITYFWKSRTKWINITASCSLTATSKRACESSFSMSQMLQCNNTSPARKKV